MSLRVLMHTPRWQQCIGELCRVASHGVVLDYPSATSSAVVESLVRKVLHPLGLASEPYRVFLGGQIRRELASPGFRVTSVHRQFVLPIALLKAIGRADSPKCRSNGWRALACSAWSVLP